MGTAVDKDGNVYVTESWGNRIQVFTADGQLITKWGSQGSGDGQVNNPRALSLDGNGNIYVVDTQNFRIQKFTSDGQFITKWGSEGSGEGQFQFINWFADGLLPLAGMAVDARGDIYIADDGNHRIQKFTSDGQFITKWGIEGSGDGQFKYPSGVCVDGSGNIYVADSYNHRIQKFSPSGQFITKWGGKGSGDGEFNEPSGISVDRSGTLYVVDSNNNRIQKFTTNGEFIGKWGIGFAFARDIAVDNGGNIYLTQPNEHRICKYSSKGYLMANWGPGDGDADLLRPYDLAMDETGRIFVSDSGNQQIKKFSADGGFIAKMGQYGSGDGEFSFPRGIAIGVSGNLYVANSSNHRIQKFDSDGRFITKWGDEGSDDGEFHYTCGIAVDGNENVYVVDRDNSRIQKFTSSGQFVTKWGSQGSGDGEFYYPEGISVDADGNVYVADCGNNKIQKFSGEGQFIAKLERPIGFDAWEFDGPSGVAFDQAGNMYVVNWGGQVLKFAPDWKFVTQFGESGSNPGQLSYAGGITIGTDARVYIADSGNHRIQVFSKEGPPVSDTSKAIIVAGGGAYKGNNLWDATQMCANYACRALTYQGYTKDTIYYLSSDTDLDLDGNGKLDDVDADATNANLQYAIKTWASDAQDLFLYMVDHGGNGTFRMSGTELLYATNLDAWLDTIQETLPGCVTMVYDACESGSFLPYLLPPAGKQRILATSTSVGQESIFVGNGTVSFSFLFWGHMFNGDSFYDAFVNAKQSVSATYNLTPQLDGDGNGIGNEKADKDAANLIKVGNETKSAGDVPVIGGVSPTQSLQGTTSATIYAEQVTDANGISRVWAVITPPDYSTGTPDTPVTDLPMIDLISVGNSRYEGTYTNFTSSGTYNIAVFAMDRKGVLSLPVQTSVTTTSSCLAVAGDLSISVPCAEYDGTGYGFTLDFYRNPDDLSGYYWKLVMATLTAGEGADCIFTGSDLSMAISCAAYNGTQYGFTLRFYNNPYDPSGLYWKMDMSTLRVQ